MEVFFGIYADGVVRGFGDMDGDVVLEEAELLQFFDEFERGGGEGVEAVEGFGAVGVEAEVLPDGEVGGGVAVVGDGGAGEVEGLMVQARDDLYGVGVGDVFRSAGGFEGCDLDCGVREGGEEGGDVLGAEEGFVTLEVDVDVGGVELGDGVDAVGAGGKVGAGEEGGPVVCAAEGEDFLGVCGDEDVVKLGAGAGGFVDPGQHGAAGEVAEDLAGKAEGGEAGGDDGEGAGRRHGRLGQGNAWVWRFDLSCGGP